ncbi:unnamed protein product [Allacma fusca]|uniref:Uncharacterized protein n=1 Tax=Allacma fusca TaxID=39272 RepID=A0A8J2LIC3_9HEXA|nr:unnamed protein product [Allacma fusca]
MLRIATWNLLFVLASFQFDFETSAHILPQYDGDDDDVVVTIETTTAAPAEKKKIEKHDSSDWRDFYKTDIQWVPKLFRDVSEVSSNFWENFGKFFSKNYDNQV